MKHAWLALAALLAVLPLRARCDGAAALLSPGDRVQIRVVGEADLSKDYQIDESGQIKLDLIGPVQAGGMTLEQFNTALGKQLSRFVKKPSYTVTAFQRVGVAGGVRQPGGYDFPKDEPIRLMDALAKAGGFAERAKKGQVLVIRRGFGKSKPETLLVDVDAYLHSKKSKSNKGDQNPVLQANDLVYVDVSDPHKGSKGILGILEKAAPFIGAFL